MMSSVRKHILSLHVAGDGDIVLCDFVRHIAGGRAGWVVNVTGDCATVTQGNGLRAIWPCKLLVRLTER